jgi:hypothetical protein
VSVAVKAEEFAAALNAILEHSLVAEGRVLRVAIIVNPAAGGFVIKKRREAWKKALQNAAAASAANPRRTVISFSGIINDECAAARLSGGGASGVFIRRSLWKGRFLRRAAP